MPPWHADAIGAGVRSTTIGEIFKGTDGACADPDTRIFPATGSRSNVAFQLNPTDFYVTRSLLWYFLGLQESTVLSRPLLFLYRLIVRGAAQEHIFQRVRSGGQAHQGHLQPA